MTPAAARTLLESTTLAWVDDTDSSVVWAGEHEGRWGLRMAQDTRDFTTIWFDVGDLTVGVEAYLLPDPPHGHHEVYRQALVRNHRSWPVRIAMHPTGDLYVRGRIALTDVSEQRIEEMVGAVYEMVEVAFGPMVKAGFAKREKSG